MKTLKELLTFSVKKHKMYTKYRRRTMKELNLKALAKINLGLDVLRRREDGYHEVKMVMQTIHLYDKIRLKKIPDREIQVETNLSYLPGNENNLVYKAAKILMDEFPFTEGISIQLNKYIPVAAGMAGGSTDAAAVLYGINRMFHLGLSLQELMERGVKIGADVPYCLMRGTALAEGIGEKLTALPPAPKCSVLIAKPPVNVSTKFVYENLKLDENTIHPNIDALVTALEEQDIRKLADNMGNVLESVTCVNYPEIQVLKEIMMKYGAMNAMMSGSGPTVFGLFEKEETAQAAAEEIKERALSKQVYVTKMFNNRRL